ncbi:par-3 family cell polarity regulator beta a isoform X1 [Ictalurus punctatus]|uniref:Par-3 family cell polarity regulator beta a isoform X1 n=1 Tax=Ictalurus punctatus TaxID=7998 RepID=A0A2D0Q4V9_ICTPU|nr:par-3 family cell polarity regulator beta a isoform X1 [Ictalurus punctatus]
MKVTVNFGSTGVVVPCKDGWIVRDLMDQATQRYKKIVEQDGEFLVRTHHVEYADGGILDPDDKLADLLEDKDKLIAVYEEMELQPRMPVSPGSSVASGYSSPYTSDPELGVLRPSMGTEIEVTSSTLKSNTPLMVRSNSELVLSRTLDTGSRDTESNNNRPTTTTGAGHVLTVKSGTVDSPGEDMMNRRNNNNSSSRLTRTVDISGDMGPLGIKVVPYLSSLSGRTLGLHVKGIEENSRTKREGIFEEDECIVQINGTELIDKSFAQSQEMFRQAMSSPVVRLEVLPVSNKLQFEKSLISQIFNSLDSAQAVGPKPKSPFLLRKADATPSDPAPSTSSFSSLTPPPREEPVMRRSPVVVERREQTPPPPVSASPTPRSRSESPASTVNPALIALATANKKGGRKMINLTKGPDGLGFTVVTRDSVVHGPGPILVKSILPRGAAVRDGRLQSGDRILEVNGVDISGYRQEELVAMLRSTKLGETVSLLVTRQEEPFLPRELKGEQPGPVLSEDGREHLMYEIPVNDSGSAGLGVSLKGNKSRETGEDLGIFVKSIIHGGAAFKDGRLRVNDQLVAVNGESLLGRSNNDAMETLRRSMSMEGNLRGAIQLIILRAMDQYPDQERRLDGGPSQTREPSPAPSAQSNPSNGVAHPPMVINSIYARAPGPAAASNGRPGVYDDDSEEDEFPTHPHDMESDFNPQRRYVQSRQERELVSNAGRPTHQLQHTRRLPEHYTPQASKSMDLVADEGNIGGRQAQKPAPVTSLGPTLGLQKSSSLESLQTAMEEASKNSVPFHRPAGPMVRGRGCNMSFRQAIDKSYDGPSEPEDDYSEDTSGRDTPVSGSSRQELEDGGKEKKKKTKKKKEEKKTKAKKKDDADEPDKKTKKKGFGLLRFGKKNKSKGKLGSLSEEEFNKSEPEMSTEADAPAPSRRHLPDVEDDDFDPNYARINNFRDPPPPSHASYPNRMPAPHYVPPTGPAYNMPPSSEDPREGLYAKVNKIKPPSQPTPESNEARLQQIRSQLQQLKPSPSYAESGAGQRLLEYDPSRIRGPELRMAPRYEDIERQIASAPRRTAVEGYKEADRYLNPSPNYNARQTPQPGSNRPPVDRSGPLRYDMPPPATPGQQVVPSYDAAIKAGSRMAGPNQYAAYEDGQYPSHRTKNPAIGAV